MGKWIVLLGLLPILAVFNYAIFEKETLIKNGELVFLELAPADPRSLMQGDYMRLRYKISLDAVEQLKQMGELAELPKSDYLVIVLDEKKHAQFARFYLGAKAVAPNERLISFKHAKRWGKRDVKIHPDSFFFQEGHGKIFQTARFGMMRLHRNGDHLLIGLADEAGIQINPSQ